MRAASLRAAAWSCSPARRRPARGAELPGDRGVAHLPVRLRPDGALLQPPAVPLGAAAAPGDPRADGDRASTRTQVLAYFQQKYGEKILSSPTTSGFNLAAWIMPFVVLLLGGAVVVITLLRWQRAPAPGRRRAPVAPRRRPASSRAPRTHARARAASASTADGSVAIAGIVGWLLAAAAARLRRLAAVSRAPRRRAEPDASRRRSSARSSRPTRRSRKRSSIARMGKLSDDDFARCTQRYRQQALAAIAGARQAQRSDAARRGRGTGAHGVLPAAAATKLPPRANFCSGCGRSLRETAA